MIKQSNFSQGQSFIGGQNFGPKNKSQLNTLSPSHGTPPPGSRRPNVPQSYGMVQPSNPLNGTYNCFHLK
eukprot:Pgem_evm1s2663